MSSPSPRYVLVDWADEWLWVLARESFGADAAIYQGILIEEEALRALPALIASLSFDDIYASSRLVPVYLDKRATTLHIEWLLKRNNARRYDKDGFAINETRPA